MEMINSLKTLARLDAHIPKPATGDSWMADEISELEDEALEPLRVDVREKVKEAAILAERKR